MFRIGYRSSRQRGLPEFKMTDARIAAITQAIENGRDQAFLEQLEDYALQFTENSVLSLNREEVLRLIAIARKNSQ